VKDFLKKNLLENLKLKPFLIILILQLFMAFLSNFLYFVLEKEKLSPSTFIELSSILPAIFITLTSGPMGEEIGWRGYALNVYLKKNSAVASGCIVGLLWGFWHLPLWLISGYSGIDLLTYIVFFLIGIIVISNLITIFYKKHKNLLVAIWIHFLFNFLLQITKTDTLRMLKYTTIVYLIVVTCIILLNRKELLKKKFMISNRFGVKANS
jgi:membrane protease YdiL (CAAX protease family)